MCLRKKGNKASWKSQKSTGKPQPYSCYSCGKTDHKRDECKFRNATCHACKRKGHIARICKSGVQILEDEEQDEDELEEPIDLMSIGSKKDGIFIPLTIEGRECELQLDTGASKTVITKSFYDRYCANVPLSKTKVVMKTYTNEPVVPLGKAEVNVVYKGQKFLLPVIVVNKGSCAVFGRDWLSKIKLDWKTLPGINYVSEKVKPDSETKLNAVLSEYSELFSDDLGCYNGSPIELNVTTQPSFFKARPVPYAMQSQVKDTLDKMESNGIIKKVKSSSCAAPIVVIKKKNTDELRICGDFSVTYNTCADLVSYPIPRIEDLHAALRGCSIFSVLDMKSAYHQVPVSENSQKYLTINTLQGLYAFSRLPFGIHSAPGLFQQIMDTTLSGIPHVICYLDDILVAGVDETEHEKTLIQVFKRLQEAGFRLSKAKCNFQMKSVKYLGHTIDAQGLHPSEDKLKAIRDAPAPENVTQLRSFLGLILFYARFIPNHSTLLAPLNDLLRQDAQWKWTSKENKAFQTAKDTLLNSQTLVHYDDRLPLYLACDCSSYGAGAVLSHRIDGIDRPIAFASCTLTSTQRNYSQTCKEAFSIMFGLQRFRQFLCGRSFTIVTDHKSLLQLFSPTGPTPVQVASRLQRWSLILALYDYKLEYRNSQAHANADGMSRLPLPTVWNPPGDNVECYFFEEDVVTNVTHEMIKNRTSKDPVLSKVYRYCLNGWPHSVDPAILPYKARRHELSLEQGCVLWGTRIIIPGDLQDMVLTELHDTHPGSSRMKMLARSYVWWPNLDAQIEEMVSACTVCQSMRSDPPKAQIHPWISTGRPWSRLHIDFAGPVDGKMYFVLIDSYSKFPEIVQMKSTTAVATVDVLREIFSRHGLPKMIVSDNGPQFTAQEFKDFCLRNGIMHRTTAVYKPSINGQAERLVQILKNALRQAKITGEDPQKLLCRYLLVY